MVALTEQKKGEIALKYLKERLSREGVKLSKDMKRDIANTAKKIGVDQKDAEQFVEELVRELVEEVFAKKQ